MDVEAAALVDAAPDGLVIVDEQGTILLVNAQMEALFDYARHELVGQPIEVLIPERFRAAHGAHRTRFRADPRRRPMGAGLNLWGRRRDGSEFPVEISLSPLREAAHLRIIATVRDISARLAAEVEARQVRRVLDGTRDAVLMFDRETLRFVYVNKGAVDQLGYSADELLAMTPLHIKPALTEPEYRQMIAELEPGASHTYATVHRRKDGVDIPVEAVLQRPPADGADPAWMVSIARDVTDRIEAEQRAGAAERDVAVLEDRQRIARDLHDRVIQRLFAAGLQLEATMGRVAEPAVVDRLRDVVSNLDDTIRELRASIFRLNAPRGASTARATIIDVCADEQDALGFEPAVRFDGPVDALPDAVRDDLVAVLREALSNVARHAQAHAASVTVLAGATELTLRVEDDGRGVAEGRESGHGLANMRARAIERGGTATVSAGATRGTVIEWRVPLPEV